MEGKKGKDGFDGFGRYSAKIMDKRIIFDVVDICTFVFITSQ